MSEMFKFDGVQVVLAEPRAQLRGVLKVALAHAGIQNIEDTGSIENVINFVENGIGPDILICDMGLDGGRACEVLSNIRQNEIGCNPFLGVIGVTWSSAVEDIDKVMNCGVDYLVSAPLSPQQIMDRIRALAKDRVPFVATSGYVGPERRGPDRRPTDTQLVKVPNTLKAKLSGSWDPNRLIKAIAHAASELMTLRISHQAGQVSKLAILIRENAAVQSQDRIDVALTRLYTIVGEMHQLVAKRAYQDVLDLTGVCVGSIEKIRTIGITKAAKEFHLLSELGRAIRIALNPNDTTTEIARDIAKTVGAIR